MSKRIVLLVTLEDTGEQTPPLDPPTADAVRAEIQANLESVWPYASVSVHECEEQPISTGFASANAYQDWLAGKNGQSDKGISGFQKER